MRGTMRLLVTMATVATLIAATAGPVLAQAPKRGGVFRVPVPEAPALDPHQNSGFVTQVYASPYQRGCAPSTSGIPTTINLEQETRA